MIIIEDNNNIIKEKAKKEIKKKIKKIAMKIAIKLISFLLPVILVVVIISAAIWFITKDEGTWDENEKGNPSTYTKSTKISSDEGIYVDKGELIKKALKSLGFTDEQIQNLTNEEIIKLLQMEDKLGKTISSLDDCTQAEILWCINDAYKKHLKKPEDLEKLLNAELITQYPKIDNLPDGKINGIVEFIRYETDPDTQQEKETKLTYISNEEFANKLNDYKNSGNSDILNFFTLDDNGNAKIAKWTREEGVFTSNNTTSQINRKKIKPGVTSDEITGNYDNRYIVSNNNENTIVATYTNYYIEEELINYKMMVQKYTLPFEYLWALLVIGKSDDFVLNLAQLAYNSEIKIGIYDNIDKRIETNTENYTEQFRERYEEFEDGNLVVQRPSGGGWETEEHEYTTTTVVTTYDNTIQYELLYANTWIVELKTEYANVITTTDGTENVSILPNEDWQDDITPNPEVKTWTTKVYHDNADGTTDIETIYHSSGLYKDKKTVEKRYISKTDQVLSTYQKQPSQEPIEKTDTDPNTDMNFVKLFLEDTNIRTTLSRPSDVSWLISILESNPDTVNMGDLTKHLIYKATNNENYKVEYSFDIFSSQQFSSVSNIYGGSVEEKVWYALIDAGYNEYAAAGAMGSFSEESGFKTNNLQNSTEARLGSDEIYTDKINSGEYTQEQFANDSAGYGLCQWTYNARKRKLYQFAVSKGVNIEDPDMQIMYMLGEITGKGEASSFTTRIWKGKIKNEGIYSTHDDWANSQSVEDATLHFMRFFESPASKSSLNSRVEAAQKYYNQFSGKERPSVGGENWTKRGVSAPRYQQFLEPWKSYPYQYKPNGTIHSGGCGACALAMATSGLLGREVTPIDIVSYLNSLKIDTVNSGETCARTIAERYNLTYKYINRSNKSEIDQALDSGKCLIFSIKANGIYTGGGHFIMCYGRDGDNYYVLESGNYYTPDVGYRFNQVFTKGNQGIFALGK